MEHSTQETETLFGRELIAMGKIYLFSIQLYKAGLAMDCHSALLLKIVETPHIMVTGEKVYLDAFIGEFGHLSKETCVAFRHNILELIPEVEHITQHIHSSRSILDFIEERYKTALMCAAMFNSPRTKMRIGEYIYLFHDSLCISIKNSSTCITEAQAQAWPPRS